MLGKTVSEIDLIPYRELLGWYAYLEERPYGWRDDNRAAVIAMSMAGDKVRPEDLFSSLKIIKNANTKIEEKSNFATKFASKFANQITDNDAWRQDED